MSISPCHYSSGNIGTNEALASGCPIFISENVGYHDAQIKSAEIGFILPLNYNSFAEKILSVYQDAKLYDHLSSNAQSFIKDNISNSAILKKYDAIFQNMGVARVCTKKSSKP